MLTVEQALERMLASCKPKESESVALGDGLGRALAADQTAGLNLPPFDNSAVDGYAINTADTLLASPDTPVTLPVVIHQAAGSSVHAEITAGSAARVLTGAPVPKGSDAVVMQEDTLPAAEGGIMITAPPAAGDHIRRAGTDVRAGEVVLTAGTALGPAEIGILAAIGAARAPVVRPARVAVLTTGDEVVDPGAPGPLADGKIYNSNRYCMQALIKLTGADTIMSEHVTDDLEKMCSGLASAVFSGADVIVCAGGVSVGDRDFVRPALERLGRIELWRVAVKPGKPVLFGTIGSTLVFGLPGNPASVLVTFELFVRPCLLSLAGRTQLGRPLVQARITDAIDHEPGRREYVRAVTRWQDGGFVSTTTGAQGSGRLRSLIGSNSLIIVPQDRESVRPGETLSVMITGDMF